MKSAGPVPAQVAVALAAAALVLALLAGFLTFSLVAMAWVLGVVLAVELVVVLPVYVLLRRKGWLNTGSVLACGFAIGAAPWGWFAWPLRFARPGSSSSRNGVDTMIDGVPTLAGWVDYALVTGLFGMFGVLAAYAFWSTVLRMQREEAAVPATAEKARWERRRLLRRAIPAGALLVVVALPFALRDRSCHNVFRDTSLLDFSPTARPKVVLYAPASPKEWDAVAEVMRGFGRSRELEVLDLTERDDSSQQLYVSLCNEGGTILSVLDRIYFFGPPMAPGKEIHVAVFGMRPQSDWRAQAAALETTLRARWGDAVRREDREPDASK